MNRNMNGISKYTPLTPLKRGVNFCKERQFRLKTSNYMTAGPQDRTTAGPQDRKTARPHDRKTNFKSTVLV